MLQPVFNLHGYKTNTPELMFKKLKYLINTIESVKTSSRFIEIKNFGEIIEKNEEKFNEFSIIIYANISLYEIENATYFILVIHLSFKVENFEISNIILICMNRC